MHTWTNIILPFIVGAISGSALVSLYFRSRVRFYGYFIKQRLADVNQRIARSHVSSREHPNVA